ncbi:MAG: hypothetical protein ACR2H7_03445 [Actinomycetota bacterium]
MPRSISSFDRSKEGQPSSTVLMIPSWWMRFTGGSMLKCPITVGTPNMEEDTPTKRGY